MADSPTAGPSKNPAASSISSQPATSFLPPAGATAPAKTTPSVGSLRNASNGSVEQAGTATAADTSTAGAEPVAPVAAPVKPVNRSASSKKAVVYSSVQRRNPVLQELQRIKQTTEIGDIPADYQVGEHAGLLFLSLKYHRLHPEYVHGRIEKIKNRYNLRILMVLCDVNEHQLSLKELSKIAIVNNLTMMVAWSNDEVAQYIAQFKVYEHKPADSLKEKVHQQYREQLQHVLTTGKRVNKTDANNLASQFGSFANIVHQQAKALSGVKGLGKTKVETLVDAFHKPFLVGGLRRKEDGGEGDAFTEDVAGRPIPAVPETGATTSTAALRTNGKGKERADAGEEEGGDVPGSPDWPDEIEDDESEEAAPVPRRRGRSPSRSPGLSPELRAVSAEGDGGDGDAGAAWRDPLEDEEDDGEADEGTADEPSAKRAKR